MNEFQLNYPKWLNGAEWSQPFFGVLHRNWAKWIARMAKSWFGGRFRCRIIHAITDFWAVDVSWMELKWPMLSVDGPFDRAVTQYFPLMHSQFSVREEINAVFCEDVVPLLKRLNSPCSGEREARNVHQKFAKTEKRYFNWMTFRTRQTAESNSKMNIFNNSSLYLLIVNVTAIVLQM